eukprot:tig00000865_g5092.t1
MPSEAFAAARKRVENGFHVKLAQGETWAAWLGPENGPLVVCIHGISIPSFQFYSLAPYLADAGLRVLIYDAWGRGKSSAPDVPYDGDTFVDQLHQLIAALKISGPFSLVGVSLGGAVATLYCDRYPESVSRLVLIDSAGLPVNMPFVGRLSLCPVIGDVLWYVAGKQVMLSRLRSDSFRSEYYDAERCRDVIDAFAEFLEDQILNKEGFLTAFRRTLVHFPMETMRENFERVGKQAGPSGAPRPTLLVWGECDSVVPIQNARELQQIFPHARLLSFPEAGHLPHIEQADKVEPALLEFLRS